MPDFRNLTSETFEGQRRDDIEARERKKDIKRQKVFREQNTAKAIEQVNKMNAPEPPIRLRNPMNLPAPQVRLSLESCSNDVVNLMNGGKSPITIQFCLTARRRIRVNCVLDTLQVYQDSRFQFECCLYFVFCSHVLQHETRN